MSILKGECENLFGELHEPGHFGYLGDFTGDGLRGKCAREADGCGGEREGGECSGAIEEALHALGHCKLGVDAQDYSEPHWLAALRDFNAQSCGKRLLGFDGLRCEHMGGVGEGQCENMCDECKQGVDAQGGSELHWLAAPRVVNAQSCGKKLPEFVGFRGEHMGGVGKGECESMCDEPHELGYLCCLDDLAGDGILAAATGDAEVLEQLHGSAEVGTRFPQAPLGRGRGRNARRRAAQRRSSDAAEALSRSSGGVQACAPTRGGTRRDTRSTSCGGGGGGGSGGSVCLVGVGGSAARVAALAAPIPDGLLSDAVRTRDDAIAAFRAGDLLRLRQAVLDADALRAAVAA